MPPTAVPSTPVLRRGTLYAMAAATGLGVANIYYNQPMLNVMADALGDPHVSAWIPALTQFGYALGLLFLLPVGDMVERKRLIVVQFLLMTGALALAAFAPSLGLLALGSLLIGVTGTVAQQIVPFAAILADEDKRGAAIGIVMSGLLSGILLSRTLAGLVSDVAGWRAMFWLAIPIALGSAALMARTLPRHAPTQSLRYRELMLSLVSLWRDEPELRRATYTQTLLFSAFSVFWTVLSLHLSEPPLNMGPAVAGLFGIIGAVGVAMAPIAGRIADRRGPRPVIIIGTLATVLSWCVLDFAPGLIGLTLGVIVLDFGVQISMVSHQHLVYGLHPEYKSRINTLYMTGLFTGGSVASFTSASLFHAHGWHAVAWLGIAISLLAACLAIVPSARSTSSRAEEQR